MKRRTFLQRSSLVSLAPFVPAFLPQAAGAMTAETDDRILVVLQLNGGNDGLNTVVPFADEHYAKHRPGLKIDTDDVLKLNESIGLHPQMKPLADLFEASKLAIVNGVGYPNPNPNRSHFESMDIWHSARLNESDRTGHGWLGRAVDTQRDQHTNSTDSDAVFIGDAEIPVALRGRRANAISLNSEAELRLFASVGKPAAKSNNDQGITAFLRRTVDPSYTAAQKFAESAPAAKNGNYPGSDLGKKMELLSRMIKLGGNTRIFYASQGGYDTHYAQRMNHGNLLRDFSRSVAAFQKDMEESGLAERVTLLAFSEFGRRVAVNGSAGTDHGTAGPVFLAGAKIKPGLHGTYPSLSDLDDGDLKMTVDFRSIYSALLRNWLQVTDNSVLNGTFAPINVIQKPGFSNFKRSAMLFCH